MASTARLSSTPTKSANVPVARDRGVLSCAPVISIHDLTVHCQSCNLRELCLPVALTGKELEQFDGLIGHRTKVNRGNSLYCAGDPFHALYAIRSGSFKTIVLAEAGQEQVAGFHMLGEIVGFDGIAAQRHGAGAIALEESVVCALPFSNVESLSRAIPTLQHNLHRMLSNELNRNHSVMIMLGSMAAEERLVVFMLNLADRYRDRGYSSTEFLLRLTREEIGSYLGLKLETVSRIFSRLQGEGFIQVQGRALKLLDLAGLNRIVGERGRRNARRSDFAH